MPLLSTPEKWRFLEYSLPASNASPCQVLTSDTFLDALSLTKDVQRQIANGETGKECFVVALSLTSPRYMIVPVRNGSLKKVLRLLVVILDETTRTSARYYAQSCQCT